MVANAVDAGRWDQGGEAGEKLVGGEDEEQGAAARALHPVDEAAVLSSGEPMQGERWPNRTAAEALQALPVVGVDPDAGVEREAVEASALRLRAASRPYAQGERGTAGRPSTGSDGRTDEISPSLGQF